MYDNQSLVYINIDIYYAEMISVALRRVIEANLTEADAVLHCLLPRAAVDHNIIIESALSRHVI